MKKPCGGCGKLLQVKAASRPVPVCHSCRRAAREAEPRKKKPSVPCATCGKLLFGGRTSLPPGERRCRGCRRAARVRECVYCGMTFIQKALDQVYCSRDCQRHCPRPAARTPEIPCEVCAQPFKPRMSRGIRQRTCSRECGTKIHSNRRAEFWEWRSMLPTCVDCGGCTFRRPGVKRCRGCAASRKAELDRAYNSRRPKALPRPKVEIACGRCGKVMVTEYVDTKWCRPCRKAVHKGEHRHRARKFGVAYEPINPIEIYERDGWTCHICSGPIRRVPGNQVDVDGWSLDHVIPMAHGGPHLKWNVKAAHWGCNVLKADSFFAEVA